LFEPKSQTLNKMDKKQKRVESGSVGASGSAGASGSTDSPSKLQDKVVLGDSLGELVRIMGCYAKSAFALAQDCNRKDLEDFIRRLHEENREHFFAISFSDESEMQQVIDRVLADTMPVGVDLSLAKLFSIHLSFETGTIICEPTFKMRDYEVTMRISTCPYSDVEDRIDHHRDMKLNPTPYKRKNPVVEEYVLVFEYDEYNIRTSIRDSKEFGSGYLKTVC
jgi:hypothetical protein